MFYSRLLLSKKGSLGSVWIAAHCPKRLRKDQVRKTDISSCVDKILADEVPNVTHRILAFLLLGVVRIHSMKVEYLFHDCNDVLNKLFEFNIGKRMRPRIGVSRTNSLLITVPKRFKLNEFDLEILEDHVIGGNTSSSEDVVLPDEQIDVGDGLGLLDKENVSFPEIHSTSSTLLRDVLSPPHMDSENDSLMHSSRETGDFVSSVEKLRGTNFLLEDWPSLTVRNGSEKEQMNYSLPSEYPRINFQGLSHEMECDSSAIPSHNRSDMLPCMENFQESRFSLEDRLDPLVLDEDEEQQIHFGSYDKDLTTHFRAPIQYSKCAMIARPSITEQGIIEEEHMEHPIIEFNLHEDEPYALPRSVDVGKPVEAEKKKTVEIITPEIRKCQGNQEQMKPMIVDVTPNSRHPGVGTPEVTTVHTPASEEHVKIPKKRKILLDPTTELPSNVLKSWINDPNDILRKRRKVPHTLLRAWRADKICHGPQCFLDPLIHSIPTDHGPINHKDDDTYTEPIADVVSEDDVNSASTIGIQEQIQDERSPPTPISHELTPFAPETPFTHLNSLRPHDIREVDILEPTSSHESFEQQSLEFITAFPDEETNSHEGDYLENGVYSARTRAVGTFLYKNFLNKKRREEDEVLNLNHLLSGKAKKNSAKLFYEILVLKSGGCIDVRQDNPYDDILLQEVPRLKQIAETDGVVQL